MLLNELSAGTPATTVAGHGGVASLSAASAAAAPAARLMSAYDDLLATVKSVRDRTGDPNAWQTGLAPTEVSAVITPTTRTDQLEAIAAKIRRQHADVFGAVPASGPPTGRSLAGTATPPDRESGAAADAIASAEAALAQQNSASSQLDMQVVSAILNAHLSAVDGREALTKLQHETEAAVLMRSDLDTPAGARDFQRFLIGKLRDIRAVVLNASLDDTSKSALMAAWTSLYDASKNEPNRPGNTRRRRPLVMHPRSVRPQSRAIPTPNGIRCWTRCRSMMTDCGPKTTRRQIRRRAPRSQRRRKRRWRPDAQLRWWATSGSGRHARLHGGVGSAGRPSLSGGDADDPALQDLAGEELPDAQEEDPSAHDASDNPDEDNDPQDVSSDEPAGGPTPVTLPDGETVTAASPQLAAAIQAAVGGTPIAEAFQQQGMTIPPPGTAVANPIDALRVGPGDIGMFTDRHALALGPDKALLDGQIQHIATVSGPNFLGWEHPPAAAAPATTPTKPEPPTPTRPATSSTT